MRKERIEMDLRKVKLIAEDSNSKYDWDSDYDPEDEKFEDDIYMSQAEMNSSTSDAVMKAKQEFAYNCMIEGRNVFITGDAGTGKSYVLNKFIDWCHQEDKNVIVTAPTGIAALNIDGSTLHRAFKAPIGPLVQPLRSLSGILKDADILIIDEISMCRIDLFEFAIKQVIKVNAMRVKDPNGKPMIQIVLSGDFFQLPPVIVDTEREVLNKYFGRDIGYGYAFQSELWEQCNFVNIVLNEVVRQNDKEFMQALNKARLGDKSCITYFQKYSSRYEIKDAILLCGTNKKAKEKNDQELSLINEKEYCFESFVEGEVKSSDKVTEDELRLKVGARVMTLVNDQEDRYKNGSFGTITQIDSKSSTVYVQIDSGVKVAIEPYTWEIKGYSTDSKGKLEKNTIGTFTQLPLKLAYAITIHKSQGQTYDKVNVNPYCWDYGQLYVALSRCKTINKMHLTQYIKPDFLKASPEVIKFYNSLSR
jgi:ATP-dependent exoDNAse (exonuclease V) alpha subunit